MRMLPCRVTKLDKIRNERIRGTAKVAEITKEAQESRLKWYGQVTRREEHYVGRKWKYKGDGREEDLLEKMVGKSER